MKRVRMSKVMMVGMMTAHVLLICLFLKIVVQTSIRLMNRIAAARRLLFQRVTILASGKHFSILFLF